MSDAAGERARRWVRADIQALRAYPVAAAEGRIKLDAMESPWPWPGDDLPAWQRAWEGVALNRYPDPGAGELKARLREAHGIPDGAQVLTGNGSDELIQLMNLALAGAGRTVTAPGPSFSMYEIIARITGSRFREVPLDGAFDLDVDAFVAAGGEDPPAVTYLAHPNNPTGNGLSPDRVEALIERTDGLVVVDEAYAAYAGHTFLPRVLEFPNLVVLRTLSKVGLAGLRVGYLAGAPAWVEELEKCRLPYNLGTPAQLGAALALERSESLSAGVEAVLAQRARLAQRLADVDGVNEVLPSQTNFVTFRVGPGRAAEVHEGLGERGVLIKKLDGSHPRLADCLRVTVGAPAENDAFLDALRAALSDPSTR